MNRKTLFAAAVAGILSLASTARAGESYQENFEAGWSNDTTTHQLSPNGAYPANWDFRMHDAGAAMWSVIDGQAPLKKVLQFKGGSFCTNWWDGGGVHNVAYTPGKTIQLDGYVREQTPTGVVDIAYVWLSTPEHNGYGFLVQRSNSYPHSNFLNDNKNYVAIYKFRDSTVKFGENPTADWKDYHGERPNPAIAVETASDSYLHFFLQLKQAAPGAPVQISLYYKDTKSAPVMTWTDDGSKIGAILDLSTLTYVGVTAENGKDIPHPIQYGAIGVNILP